jgi:hypothetical protein
MSLICLQEGDPWFAKTDYKTYVHQFIEKQSIGHEAPILLHMNRKIHTVRTFQFQISNTNVSITELVPNTTSFLIRLLMCTLYSDFYKCTYI